jgi:predicted nucleotidyltransferase
MKNINEAKKYLILQGYAGSLSYGTNTATSDIDIKGVYLPPKPYWLGMQSTDHVRSTESEDLFYHSLKKFLHLALNNNPNILEMLYLRENHYIWKDVPKDLKRLGRKLIDNRALFLSKKCKHSYLGYAYEQFHRMDRLNKNVNQNKSRLALVEKFGYDTKNAMHMIRLLRTGLEILTEHEIHVFRKDAKDLLDIKNGKYTYEELKVEFERYKELVEHSYTTSDLQYAPDFEKVDKLCIEMVEEALEIFQKRT